MLASFSRRLRPGGRLALDVFNRDFFEAQEHELERELKPADHGHACVLKVASDGIPTMQLVLQRDE